MLINSFIFIEPFFLQRLFALPKTEVWGLGLALASPCLILLALKHYKLLAVLSLLLKLNIFILIIIFFMSFSSSLQTLILQFVRFNIIMLFQLLLFYKENIFYISYAFKRPQKFALLIFFTLSFFVRLNELRLIRQQAFDLRSFKPRLKPRLKAYGYLIAGLIVDTFNQSSQMSINLELRGFKGVLPVFSHYKIRSLDCFLLLLCLIQGALCLIYLS